MPERKPCAGDQEAFILYAVAGVLAQISMGVKRGFESRRSRPDEQGFCASPRQTAESSWGGLIQRVFIGVILAWIALLAHHVLERATRPDGDIGTAGSTSAPPA